MLGDVIVVELEITVQQNEKLSVFVLMRRVRHLACRKRGVMNVEEFSIGDLAVEHLARLEPCFLLHCFQALQ